MKGFTKDGKFHPIKSYNKVRKSKDQTAKTKGVKLDYRSDTELGVEVAEEGQCPKCGSPKGYLCRKGCEDFEAPEFRKAREVRGQFFKMFQPEAEIFQAPQDEQDVDNFLMSLDFPTVERAIKKAEVFEIGDGDFFIKRVEIGNIERIFKQRKNESEHEYFEKLRLLEGHLLAEVEDEIKIPFGSLAVQIEDEDQILQIDWILDMDNPAEKRFLEKEGLMF